MQKFYSLAGIGVAAMLFSVGLNYYQRGEINALKLQEKLIQCENRLLEDQLREYEYKASTTRTYEEGLTQGLVRSASTGYVDGYHAAMAQVEESRAYIAEQEQKKSEQSLAENKDKTDTASKNAAPASIPASTNK
jgi:hypothetical protein